MAMYGIENICVWKCPMCKTIINDRLKDLSSMGKLLGIKKQSLREDDG